MALSIVYNDEWEHHKVKIVVGHVVGSPFPYICEDSSMWKNAEIMEEKNIGEGVKTVATEIVNINTMAELYPWLDRNVPSHHSSSEYREGE